jgi:hypothetical protein
MVSADKRENIQVMFSSGLSGDLQNNSTDQLKSALAILRIVRLTLEHCFYS